MNILIIATGGTIGSSFDGECVNVRTDGRSEVIDRYLSTHPDIRFDIRHPLNILSERITADDFNALAKALYEVELSAYDGVILTLGSDSLAYISSFVGLLFGNKHDIPIMLVAANKILSAPDSNGYENFCCAVELIKRGTRGAYVPYRNSDGVMYVHTATDLRQADLSEDFYSLHGAYATYDGTLHPLRSPIFHTVPDCFSADDPPKISDNVLLLHPYPMQDYSALSTCGKKAVLHTLYHSATLDSTSALAFLDSLGSVPFYIATLRGGQKPYATTKEIIEAGAIPLCGISPECAYMKLLLACAQEKMSIKTFMEADR